MSDTSEKMPPIRYSGFVRPLETVQDDLVEALDLAIEHDKDTPLGRIARHAVRHLGWELYQDHASSPSARSDIAWTIAYRITRPSDAVDIMSKRWDRIGSWYA